MDCGRVTLPNGASAIFCGTGLRTRRCACGSGLPADRLCDWKVNNRKSGTCDAKLCARCAHQPAPEKDLCPVHATEWKARCATRGAA